LAGDERIGPLRRELEDPRAVVVVSAVCIWEAAIKSALGKLEVPNDLPRLLDEFEFEKLSVTDQHAWMVRDLPLHHGDPFDRLLVAQALVERATLISADEGFDAYKVPRRWPG
jgi:PIN domain nuclease of toxin-antitoxin system